MKRIQQFNQILEKLLLGIAPKAIANMLEVPYASVIRIKNRYTDTVITLKEGIREQGQLGFHFFHGHNKGQDDETES